MPESIIKHFNKHVETGIKDEPGILAFCQPKTFQQKETLIGHPQLERSFRLVYQGAYSALQLRTKYLYNFSREQLLASYLNMTPG